MKTILKLVVLLIALVISTTAEARRGGLVCGAVQAQHFGYGSRLALDWARDFRHVPAQAGAVVVQRRNGRDSAGHPGGHVSRIIQMTKLPCRALVADEKGEYERDICTRLVAYVLPDPASWRQRTAVSPLVKATSRHLSPRAVAYASAQPDRFTPR